MTTFNSFYLPLLENIETTIINSIALFLVVVLLALLATIQYVSLTD